MQFKQFKQRIPSPGMPQYTTMPVGQGMGSNAREMLTEQDYMGPVQQGQPQMIDRNAGMLPPAGQTMKPFSPPQEYGQFQQGQQMQYPIQTMRPGMSYQQTRGEPSAPPMEQEVQTMPTRQFQKRLMGTPGQPLMNRASRAKGAVQGILSTPPNKGRSPQIGGGFK